MNSSTDKKLIYNLIEICCKKGIYDFVICPGSRNAPLVIALQNKKNIQIHNIVDERSAGFFALGLALQSQKTVVLICSSGSAALNFSPAICEAFYQSIPLLILTADRPKQFTNQMVGQTINQTYVFDHFIKQSYELPLMNSELNNYYANRIINEAINLTSFKKQSPVHINIPMEEPLYNTSKIKNDEIRIIEQDFSQKEISSEKFENCILSWKKFDKKMILIGQMQKNEFLEYQLKILSNDPSVVIISENISNININKSIQCIDRTLESIDKKNKDFQPNLLLTIGGAIVSKKIKSFLKNSPIKEHWNFSTSDYLIDTFSKLTHQFDCNETNFIKKLNEYQTTTNSTFQYLWKQKDFVIHDNQNLVIEKLPFCDLKVFCKINQWIPEQSIVHLGNSSIIRYSQLFNSIPNVLYQSNRGVSGIDGCTSTAYGFSFHSNQQNILITGDLAFMYDSNALWLNPPENLKIIVINNGGGGIFKIISGPKTTTNCNKNFVTSHNKNFKKLIESHNLKYVSISSDEETEYKLETFFYNTIGFAILEINTQNINNEEFLKTYFKSTNA